MNGGTYRLAPMSGLILGLTVALLPLPALFLVLSATTQRVLALPALFVVAIYAWVWLWFRPSRFLVLPHAVEVVWPMRREWIPRAEITAVRRMTTREFRDELGLAVRIGAGGLWGGFGWLWTTKRGIVRMYVSRTDDFVWIERGASRPWLVTPERPEDFVRALTTPVAS